MNILAISGSLRAASLNTALLRAMQAAAPAGVELELFGLHDLPFFNEDLETAGARPTAVQTLRDKVRQADALLVSTPEYNSGIPGVLKNAFDWLSRSDAQNPSVLMNKPMALVGASMGSFGTAIAQASALPMIRALGLQLWAGQRLALPQAHTVFNAQGQLLDEATRTMLQSYMAGWVESIAKHR
jgi:NAD(P)H-dependent FMN reductase